MKAIPELTDHFVSLYSIDLRGKGHDIRQKVRTSATYAHDRIKRIDKYDVVIIMLVAHTFYKLFY